jgi:hypothetical protein
MSFKKEILCINKTKNTGYWERISHIGGPGWRYSEEQAIEFIHADVFDFFIMKDGYELAILIGEREGKEYLKTEKDYFSPDGLLVCKECKW